LSENCNLKLKISQKKSGGAKSRSDPSAVVPGPWPRASVEGIATGRFGRREPVRGKKHGKFPRFPPTGKKNMRENEKISLNPLAY
jgi:hypothetical protein